MTNKKDHIIVFIISTLLFITGVFSGLIISKTRVNTLENKVNTFENSINSFETAVLIDNAINNKTLSCVFLKGKINETQLILEELGKKAIDYEENSKIKDNDYFKLKKQYSKARLEYWLMLEKLKNECDNNYTTILFFYRTKTPCPECRDQGVILTHIASKIKNIHLIPVDADEEILLMSIIKEAFKITITPTIIINARDKIEGLISESELISRLNNTYLNLSSVNNTITST